MIFNIQTILQSHFLLFNTRTFGSCRNEIVGNGANLIGSHFRSRSLYQPRLWFWPEDLSIQTMGGRLAISTSTALAAPGAGSPNCYTLQLLLRL
jgi:hypothetical protein